MFYLSLICIQSFAVAANLTVKVAQLLCQPHGLMGARPFSLILPELFLQFTAPVRCGI